MITRLRLTNFKAWRELQVRFATVTGVFGANSAGKSSLIQFLLLLKQTRDATDRRIVLDFGGPESPANLGSYREVVHGRDARADISWELTWLPTRRRRIKAQSADGKSVEFTGREMATSCTVGLSRTTESTLSARLLSYRIGESTFRLRPKAVVTGGGIRSRLPVRTPRSISSEARDVRSGFPHPSRLTRSLNRSGGPTRTPISSTIWKWPTRA